MTEAAPSPVTLVVGAAQGIGRATAEALARAGHRLVLADRKAEGLRKTVALLGGSVPTYPVDIRDHDAVAYLVENIESEHGPIEHLAHVAGVFTTGSVLDSDPEDWQHMYDVNVTGLLSVLRSVGRAMRERRSGSIVVVGSNSAGVPRMGMGAYGSSKAASTMIVRILGLELAQYGIRANIVAPGSTDTAMQRSLWEDPNDDAGARSAIEGDLSQFKVGIPLGRIAEPADIAEAIEFLLSDRARHITMQALYIDGGATLRA
ncbi:MULTISPECIES: 2,3-dihydro-2,3-dihydroxybenzoate dehydrogenase [Rhodococcus]|uniref:2,3-dihydro-2,3-dihydroxybenzoate dehydrogenase n=1 Tax=Rhodococcus TaxID=1827 RepID=UPI001E315A00|nr:2,3-dihydro-2,3-dihydroxybenzoate dehydrogenase [Rhodococcus pyridinivorans]MCD2115819.1 2,3-dihydro-2,3-dihydroxybenzoate dehydrogenase [Rhodococcus pyridinivorans]MCZ4624680.1 2,3-dihydro-2,3-dihydroxybenzoate dehydrogenase [Rhodococcus pyridinivorans]MCZ4645892.1 2,3-dihydro-2,3-dihydroxybenzoate dehydrogenase [Rhodococcus pyridinivorans]MDJ0483175.1 2,3-dihydro-2,3-dihydroxybenzoate dehydrogenase [Rhodococcus pyridinivorans]MDV7252152.1 2,3-dihydro-2,3-dihydroxybenzoate dehydrogenase [R